MMKAQQALEAKTTEKPIFVEAEKLINRMEEMTKNIAQRAYEFFEERGGGLVMNWMTGFALNPN